MRRGEPRWGRVVIGLRRPRRGVRVLGLEFAGDVTAVGPAVRRLRVGDRVFGFTSFGAGANAEYKCLSERASITTMPDNVAYAQAAAAVDGFTTAWHFLHDLAKVQPGQRVLVIGASGSIGTYAIQLAKYLGAVVPACAAAGTRSWSNRSALIGSSTTPVRTSPPAASATARSSTLWAVVRSPGVDRCWRHVVVTCRRPV